MDEQAATIERKVRDLLQAIAPRMADAIETMDPAARIWETIDSLSLLDLLTRLEDHFHIVIESVDVIPDNFRSISRIVRYVARSTTLRGSGPGG